MTARTLTGSSQSFPIRGTFTISRGSRTKSVVVVAEVAEAGIRGRGECVPYARYGESVDSVLSQIEAAAPAVRDGATREDLRGQMPPGAARNAVDAALWDLDAKRTGRRAWELAGLLPPKPCITAYTLSLDAPEAMATAATAARDRPLLKLKLGGDGDIERVAAVRHAVPEARLIVDANEAWTPAMLAPYLAAMAEHRVELIEQPLPAYADDVLGTMDRPVPVCADESCHDRASLSRLVGCYDYVNVKLDKTGGLTEALDLVRAARALGLRIMVGSMLGTSLAMAPAMVAARQADFVDLDGPLLLARDREPGLRYEGSVLYPPEPALWG